MPPKKRPAAKPAQSAPSPKKHPVEKLCGMRWVAERGREVLEHKVRWAGYGREDDQWVKASQLKRDCPELVEKLRASIASFLNGNTGRLQSDRPSGAGIGHAWRGEPPVFTNTPSTFAAAEPVTDEEPVASTSTAPNVAANLPSLDLNSPGGQPPRNYYPIIDILDKEEKDVLVDGVVEKHLHYKVTDGKEVWWVGEEDLDAGGRLHESLGAKRMLRALGEVLLFLRKSSDQGIVRQFDMEAINAIQDESLRNPICEFIAEMKEPPAHVEPTRMQFGNDQAERRLRNTRNLAAKWGLSADEVKFRSEKNLCFNCALPHSVSECPTRPNLKPKQQTQPKKGKARRSGYDDGGGSLTGNAPSKPASPPRSPILHRIEINTPSKNPLGAEETAINDECGSTHSTRQLNDPLNVEDTSVGESYIEPNPVASSLRPAESQHEARDGEAVDEAMGKKIDGRLDSPKSPPPAGSPTGSPPDDGEDAGSNEGLIDATGDSSMGEPGQNELKKNTMEASMHSAAVVETQRIEPAESEGKGDELEERVKETTPSTSPPETAPERETSAEVESGVHAALDAIGAMIESRALPRMPLDAGASLPAISASTLQASAAPEKEPDDGAAALTAPPTSSQTPPPPPTSTSPIPPPPPLTPPPSHGEPETPSGGRRNRWDVQPPATHASAAATLSKKVFVPTSSDASAPRPPTHHDSSASEPTPEELSALPYGIAWDIMVAMGFGDATSKVRLSKPVDATTDFRVPNECRAKDVRGYGTEEEPDRSAWNLPTTSGSVHTKVNFHTTVAPPHDPAARTEQGAMPQLPLELRRSYIERIRCMRSGEEAEERRERAKEKGRERAASERAKEKARERGVAERVEARLPEAYAADDVYCEGHTGTQADKKLWNDERYAAITFYNHERNLALQHRHSQPARQQDDINIIISNLEVMIGLEEKRLYNAPWVRRAAERRQAEIDASSHSVMRTTCTSDVDSDDGFQGMSSVDAEGRPIAAPTFKPRERIPSPMPARHVPLEAILLKRCRQHSGNDTLTRDELFGSRYNEWKSILDEKVREQRVSREGESFQPDSIWIARNGNGAVLVREVKDAVRPKPKQRAKGAVFQPGRTIDHRIDKLTVFTNEQL